VKPTAETLALYRKIRDAAIGRAIGRIAEGCTILRYDRKAFPSLPCGEKSVKSISRKANNDNKSTG
jgi:hypothetical protein